MEKDVNNEESKHKKQLKGVVDLYVTKDRIIRA